MKKQQGVMSIGIRLPIIKEGDNLKKIIVDRVLDTVWDGERWDTIDDLTQKYGFRTEHVDIYDLNDRDVIGITESIVARAMGNYVTVDEIAEEIRTRFGEHDEIIVINPIYSRNRFSMILKAIARASNKYVKIIMPDHDEVGNPSGVNRFTGVDIEEYYKQIVKSERRIPNIVKTSYLDQYNFWIVNDEKKLNIYCGLHDYEEVKDKYGDKNFITLADICSGKCEYGLLGSNKATEEKLKLFPNASQSEYS